MLHFRVRPFCKIFSCNGCNGWNQTKISTRFVFLLLILPNRRFWFSGKRAYSCGLCWRTGKRRLQPDVLKFCGANLGALLTLSDYVSGLYSGLTCSFWWRKEVSSFGVYIGKVNVFGCFFFIFHNFVGHPRVNAQNYSVGLFFILILHKKQKPLCFHRNECTHLSFLLNLKNVWDVLAKKR